MSSRKYLVASLVLSLACVWWGGVACGPVQTPCSTNRDCIDAQVCSSGACVSPEPAGESQAEPGPEPKAEPRADEPASSPDEPMSADEPSAPDAAPEPPPERRPEMRPEPTPGGCAGGPACQPSELCSTREGKCVPRLCGPCKTGDKCDNGGVCLTTNATPKESFCGRDCSGGKSCPPGFRCFAINNGQLHQCAPTSVTCKAPVGIGQVCRGAGAAACPHHFPHCSSLDANKDGVCTRLCNEVKDCPRGYKRCADRGDGKKVCLQGCLSDDDCPSATPLCVDVNGTKECQEPPYTGPEVCGRNKANAKGVGKACPNGDGDCSGGFCLGKGVDVIAPFCSQSCQADADCGANAHCRHVLRGGKREKACLPVDCLCLEAPDLQGNKDLMSAALTQVGRSRCSLIYTKRELGLISPRVAHDPFRLGFFNRVHREPLQFLAWSKARVKDLDEALKQPGLEAVPAALRNAAAWLDHPIKPTPPTITPAASAPFANAVATLIKDHGGTPDLAALTQAAAKIPSALQTPLARIVLAISLAAKARNDALNADVKANPAYYFTRAPYVVLPSAQRFSFGSPAAPSKDYLLLAKGFGYQKMYQGAWLLAQVIASAKLAADPGYTGFSFNQQTPIGRVIISDNADHTYVAGDAKYQGDIALLVDTGGDDTYEIQAGANTSAKNPVSVLLDLAGADKYAYKVVPHTLDKDRFPSDDGGRFNAPGFCDANRKCGVFVGPCVNHACQRACKTDAQCPSGDSCDVAKGHCKKLVTASGPFSLSNRARQGAGRLGIGFLFDLGKEKDTYESLRMSQGFGALGVGVLYDAGGDERYQCETGCQGGGMFGIGLLIDRAGNDTYRTYSNAQGFGYSRGAGLLLDQSGDDKYLADHGSDKADVVPGRKGDPLYLSAQLAGRANSSFVQGAGFGRRADFSDNMFMSGGIGILRDQTGDDAYTAGVFGQGTGFWYGTGILADGDGKDTYDGFWYVQGATAHFALSALLEGGGDDKYNTILPPRATHTGTGHDFSTSWLVDQSGNDTYVCAGLTLGAGNDNGYGFLIDNGGDDKYSSSNDNSFGRANSPNPDTNGRNTAKVRSLGMFIDAGGTDTYTRPKNMSILGDDKQWTQGRSPAGSARRKLEHGVGIDQNTKATSTVSAK